jgi:addiction module RelB/DinJ family antitoxin
MIESVMQLQYNDVQMHEGGVYMSKSTTICLRIDENLKRDSEAVLRKLGMSTSEAIKIFLSAVLNRKGIPFPVQLDVATPEAVVSSNRSMLSLRGQFPNVTSSDEFALRKQAEIDKEESRFKS